MSYNMKCFKCNKEYMESDEYELPVDCLCPKCKPIIPWVIIKYAIIILIIIFTAIIIIGFTFAFGPTNVVTTLTEKLNDTCSGDNCTNESGYTYEDNLNDPLCYTRINFCNLNDTFENTSSNAAGVISLLKLVNYQQQKDIQSCNKNLSEDNNKFIALIVALIIAALWAGYVTFLKNASPKKM
jgi:hypothetical protein